MANNEYINKVEYGNETLIDITSTTAEEDDVIEGKSFFLKSGGPCNRNIRRCNYKYAWFDVYY